MGPTIHTSILLLLVFGVSLIDSSVQLADIYTIMKPSLEPIQIKERWIKRSFPKFNLIINNLYLSNLVIQGFDNSEMECEENGRNLRCIISFKDIYVTSDFKTAFILENRISKYTGDITANLQNMKVYVDDIFTNETNISFLDSITYIDMDSANVKLTLPDNKEKGIDATQFLNKYFLSLLREHKTALRPILSKEIRNLLGSWDILRILKRVQDALAGYNNVFDTILGSATLNLNILMDEMYKAKSNERIQDALVESILNELHYKNNPVT